MSACAFKIPEALDSPWALIHCSRVAPVRDNSQNCCVRSVMSYSTTLSTSCKMNQFRGIFFAHLPPLFFYETSRILPFIHCAYMHRRPDGLLHPSPFALS